MRSCGFPPYQQHDPRTTCHAARIPPTAHAASDMSQQLQPDTWRSGVQIGRAWRPSAPALTSWYGPIAWSNVPARPNRGSRNQAGPHQKFTCFAPISERLFPFSSQLPLACWSARCCLQTALRQFIWQNSWLDNTPYEAFAVKSCGWQSNLGFFGIVSHQLILNRVRPIIDPRLDEC